MEPAAELEFVRQARMGDDAAFESLLRQMFPPGYRLACGMLQDRQLAEDAVQEAGVMAWQKLHELRPGSTMQPWFLGIVANQCRTIRRGRWWSLAKTAFPGHSVEAPDDSVVRRADMRRALARLNLDQRMVVVLYFYLDLPLQEIAAITGDSFAAVRSRLYRALRQLKPDVEAWEFQS